MHAEQYLPDHLDPLDYGLPAPRRRCRVCAEVRDHVAYPPEIGGPLGRGRTCRPCLDYGPRPARLPLVGRTAGSGHVFVDSLPVTPDD